MSFSRKFISSLVLCMISALLISGCTSFRARMLVKSMHPLMEKMSVSVNKSDDVDLVREGLPYSLIFVDGLIEAAPDDSYILLRAAEAYNGYSFAFVEDKDKKRAAKLYLKARDYALRVLKENDDFREALDKPLDQFLPTLKQFDEDDVPALFWAASSWLSWIGLSLDNPEVFIDLPKVEAILNRIVELNENYFYGATHTILGSFYASEPVVFGGKPEKAKYHFDRSFEISKSKLLIAHLMYAKFYAYQIQDRKLFVETLENVIAAPNDLLPEKRFANKVTKIKAKMLLENVDEYF